MIGDGDYGNVTIRSGKITKHTLFQSLVFSIVIAPIILLIQNNWKIDNCIWVIVCMFVAPIIVDFFKPTIFVKGQNNDVKG